MTPATSLRDPARQGLPLGAVFSLDVVLMVLSPACVLGVWPHGSIAVLRRRRRSSTSMISLVARADLLRDVGDPGRGGAEDGALQHSARAALGLRVPDPQHAVALQWITELLPATHFIRRQPRDLPARRGAAQLLDRTLVARRSSASACSSRSRSAPRDARMNAVPPLRSNVWRSRTGGTVHAPRQGFLGVGARAAVMMLLLFGFALSNEPGERAVGDARSEHSAVAPFVAEIERRATSCRRSESTSYEEAAAARRGEALALLVIPPTSQRDLERGGAHGAAAARRRRSRSRRRGSAATSVRSRAASTARAAARRARHPDGARTGWRSHLRQRFWFNPTLARPQLLPRGARGMLLTNLCFSASSLGLVGERESGTYEQMLALPTTPVEIVLGKLVPYVAICLHRARCSRSCSGLVFGLWPKGSWSRSSCSRCPSCSRRSRSACSYPLGRATHRRRPSSSRVFFILPSFVLSGVMFPYQLMPPGIRANRRACCRCAGIRSRCAGSSCAARRTQPTTAIPAFAMLLISPACWR